jgi:hypothetical protein
LQVTCHMMPFTKQHSACAWVVTCILFSINLTFHNLSLHSSFTIHQPFTDYFFTTTIIRAVWKTFFSLSGQPSSSSHRRFLKWWPKKSYRIGPFQWEMNGLGCPSLEKHALMVHKILKAGNSFFALSIYHWQSILQSPA